MIWIPIFIIAGIVLAVLFSLDFADSIIGKVLCHIITIPLCAGIGCFVGVAVWALFGIIGAMLFPTETETIFQAPIYSISDQNQQKGNFVLGSGYVDSNLYIYYVAELEAGKQIKRADRESTTIVESDAESPSVTIVGERYKWEWVNWLAIDFHSRLDQTTIVVPNGTIITEYKVDLK